MTVVPHHARQGTADGSDHVVSAMTVDVEDYFQVQAFADIVPYESWESFQSRVEKNTEKILQLFSDAGIKGTFFTLGWIAERYPHLVQRIVTEGHELASHGYRHVRADLQTPSQFRDDVSKAKRILEDTSGVAISGYRAATFSIGLSNSWAFEILGDVGYSYSSSTHPIKHDLYGVGMRTRGAFSATNSGTLKEIPITTIKLFERNLPFAGGGYFRLLPYEVSRAAMRHVIRSDKHPAVFYLHPWELDPAQPRFSKARAKSKLRHYLNLGATEGRLKRLIRDFSWARMDQVFSDIIQKD